MKKYRAVLSSLVIFGLLLSGCSSGGGSDSTIQQTPQNKVAYFIDSPVAGLAYRSQSEEGITSADGAFEYAPSDINVTFKVGEIILGTVNVADINEDSKLFIQDLLGVERDNITDPSVLKIASFLLSLDTGVNANGITLDENELLNFNETKEIEDVNITRELALVGKTPKPELDVIEHLGTTIRENGIALYNYTPQSFDLNITTFKDIITNGTLTATDKNDNFLEYSIISPPTHGTVELIADTNSFKYTPSAGYVGSDSFTFNAYDGEKYSQAATVNIDVKDMLVTSNDVTPPTAPTIVSLDAQKNSLTLFWLNAIDETTPADEIRYEVHLSTDANFTANTSTLKQTLVNALEADITGLNANTLYYVKVIALDSADNNATSQENSMQTLSQEVVLATSASVKKATELHLENAVEDNNTLIFEDSEKAEVPDAGDILIGNAQDAYFKRVVSVEKNDSTTKIVVEDAAISDVVERAKLSSKVVLFGIGTDTTTAQSPIRRSVGYLANNIKESEMSWASGRFGMIEKSALAMSSAKRSLSKSNSAFSVTVVQDIITVAANETLTIELNAQLTQDAIDDEWAFTDAKLISFTHNGSEVSGRYWFPIIDKESVEAYLKWTPASEDISDTEYIATYEVCAEDKNDDNDIIWGDSECETLQSKIKVIAKPQEESGKTTIDTSVSTYKEFTNVINLDFTPTLVVNTEVADGDVTSAEVSIAGRLDFNVSSTFLYEAAVNREYKVDDIVNKTYYKMYMLGAVPVYQEITFTIDAVLNAEAKSEIDATSDLDTSFEMVAGVKYDGESWNKIPIEPTLQKEYTATFNVSGEVDVNVRLIPNIEVNFYKVATAGFSVEPWLAGNLKASGKGTVYTDFEDLDTMAIYRLENLKIEAGLEGKVYANLKVWKITLAKYPSDALDAEDGTVDGKKTVFNPSLNIFDIPTITLAQNYTDVCSDIPYQINAQITNPDSLIANDFDTSSIKWKVFPSSGAFITPTSVDKLQATFDFTQQGVYTVYMIGNNEKLGSVFGQQYATYTVDTTGCAIATVDVTPPVFTTGSAASVDVYENQTDAITLTATDNESTVTYSISGQDSPSFDVNATTGVVTFKTAPDYEAQPTKTTYLFVATATDEAGNEATQNITINILDVDEPLSNQTPTATPLSFTVYENQDLNVTLLGSDADGDTLSYSYTQPSHGSLSGTAPNLIYTPTAGYTGADSFTYKVNDGTVDSAVASVSITVNAATTETITHNGFTYGTVTSPYTGRIWLDRNLGASRVCTALDDTACYGDYYQWGRNADGHEKITSSASTIQATDINNAGNSFIIDDGTYNYDWAYNADANGTLRRTNWSKIDGSSICPVDYRVPTIEEIEAETINEGINNYNDAINSFLKLAPAGDRLDTNASLRAQGTAGHIWSTTTDGTNALYMNFYSSEAYTYSYNRARGYSVRCIKDEAKQNTPPTAQDQNITVAQDSADNAITLTGTDADGDTLTYSIVTPQSHGSLSGVLPNITYTPTTGYSGTDSFTYKVNDGTVDSAVATINITISATQTSTTSIIKKTGQTKSYDANGAEVTDGTLKDDGYYQKGVTPQYTRASDIVTDELTGLMWQDDAAVSSVTKQWLTDENYNTCGNDTSSPACNDTSGDTAATYCSELTLGGYTDWRLPTSKELEGIVDYTKYSPAIDITYFNNVSSGGYWSSITYGVSGYSAWSVSFSYGHVYYNLKDANYYVRCVRDGE